MSMVMRKMANCLQRRALRGLSSLGTTRGMSDDLVHPIQYFREFPMFRDGRNSMMKTFPENRNPLLPTNTGATSGRSFPKLVAGYHARGLCLGKALSLDNIAVSRRTNSFVLLHVDESSLPPFSEQGRVADLNFCGGALDFCVKKSMRDTYGYPHCFKDLLKKLKSSNPPYKRILWHPCCFSSLSAFWFRIMTDLRLRKEFNHHKDYVCPIRIERILSKMPHFRDKKQVQSLITIAKRDKFINACLRKHKLTEEQCADEEYLPWTELLSGRCLVLVNRDGLAHLFQTEGSDLGDLKPFMSLEYAIDMMRLEFDEFECRTVDLFEKNLLYPDLGMPELFGETIDKWANIMQKEIYIVQRKNVPKPESDSESETED